MTAPSQINYFNEFGVYCFAPVFTGLVIYLAYRNKVRKLRAELRYGGQRVETSVSMTGLMLLSPGRLEFTSVSGQ